ncbi:ATP-binding protein IstB [Paenisporosarcina cavernae]|uniref:ATP-binding protein IstB n=2 Tax=Paenisporosarcina cavernae TaxID=2320858 RepID=A0A385YU00_9BACL|nr:ATP-binding protein IstB [Paenisporosarcina cavernae]
MLQTVGQALESLLKSRPELAKRMKDANALLETNPVEILTIPSDKCPHRSCDGSGWIWKKDWSKRTPEFREESDEWQEPCACYEQRKKQNEISRKIDLSGIPFIFREATVRSFDPLLYKSQKSIDTATIAKQAAVKFIENFEEMKNAGKGLYLFSEKKGSGKTRLASSIANALVKVHGVDIAFLKANDLLSQIKKTFSNEISTSEIDIIQVFRKVEVLVIDDIAIEKPSEFAERVFFDIVDYRLEHKKVTFFTSNKTIENLAKIYKEGRVHSRINKMCLELYLPEESIRDDEAEKENADIEKILFGQAGD